MRSINFHEVEALLTVIEKCAMHPGRFGGIAGQATRQLLEINENILVEQMLEAKAREAVQAAEAAAIAEATARAIPSTSVLETPAPAAPPTEPPPTQPTEEPPHE
jgi:hypothetical protein